MKLPLLLTFTALISSGFLHAQGGPLVPPPGSPGKTMKSLDEIEARTPLVAGAPGVTIAPGTGSITISQSGSYYLAGNLSVSEGTGITITADSVTLDLNGFTVTSTAEPAAGHGVLIEGERKGVTISGGHITGGFDLDANAGPGFLNGVKNTGVGPVQMRRITVTGCQENGIDVGNLPNGLSVVESCIVREVGGTGIIAKTIDRCNAIKCGEGGILGEIVTASKASTSNGTGIKGDIVTHCHGASVDGAAIIGMMVNGCLGQSFNGTGIFGTSVAHSIGFSSENHGITANSIVSYSKGSTGNPIDGRRGINAPIGVASDASGASGIINKYLMP